MKITIFGAGALGSVLGAILSRENDILLITRGEHLKKIQENGLVVRGLTQGTFKLDAVNYYPGGFDVIILTVKAYQTEEALREIKKEYSGEAIITFQNGVGIVDLLKDLDVIPGVTTHGATFIEPGVVMHAGMGYTYIGERNGKITERVMNVARNFTYCGLNTEVVNDIMERRWIKAAINACINPLTAILNVKNGSLLDEDLDFVVRCIANECEEILGMKGIHTNVYAEARKVIENTAENYSSMLQDLKRGKRTEVDYIVKPFSEGKCNMSMYYLIKFLEKRGEGDFEP